MSTTNSSATISTEEPPLPDSVPGVAIATALQRINGNQTLLRELLLLSQQEFVVALETIQPALAGASGDGLQPIGKLAHKIKGIAANIAALELFESAKELEQEIQRNDHPTTLPRFAQNLAQVLRSLTTLTLQHTPTAAPTSQPVELHPLIPQLQQLAVLLNDFDTQSRNHFETIRSALATHSIGQQELLRLSECIDRFDFANAQNALTHLAEQLGLSLDNEN